MKNDGKRKAGGSRGAERGTADLVRREVRDLLQGSAAFARLPAERQREIADATARIATYLSMPEGSSAQGLRPERVDFPDFVAGLVGGVFQSVVTASVEQMEAYGRLVADVAATLEQFVDDNVTDDQARDHLLSAHPELLSEPETEPGGQRPFSAARARLATGRQQLLATMVLMGINRIVVTDGQIRAAVPPRAS